MTGTRYLAVHEMDEHTVTVSVDTTYQRVAVYRVPDRGTATDILRAHGWRIVTAWTAADDVPSGAERAMVERIGEQ
jgi:hypothetical protein